MVNYMYSGVAYVRNALDSNNRTTITLNPETADIDNLVRVSTTVSGKLTTYNLFGEHNKPTGTYTGNSAARTIDVGGAGNFLVIKNETQAIAFVTQYGALLFYCLGATYVATVPTVKWVTDEMVNFTDGKLNIASYATHQEEGYSTINSSYAEYTYYVI